MSLLGERLCQMDCALASPAQRGLWVASRHRIDPLLQCRLQIGIGLTAALSAAAH